MNTTDKLRHDEIHSMVIFRDKINEIINVLNKIIIEKEMDHTRKYWTDVQKIEQAKEWLKID